MATIYVDETGRKQAVDVHWPGIEFQHYAHGSGAPLLITFCA
jgi:hypothetical protein